MSTVVIIEDNPGVCEALALLLDLHGIRTHTAATPDAGAQLVQRLNPDVIIQDMNFVEDKTSGEEGRQLFARLHARNPDIPIVLLTAWTDLEQAVDLVKQGAADYLQKPWDDQKLINTIQNLLELSHHRKTRAQQHERRQQRRAALADQFDLCGLVYASDVMHEVLVLATRVARADVPVLITGPNGSGKQKIAEIVQANSQVEDRAFITVNAGALPENLIEAELFGAEAGAYTGATKSRQGRFSAADGGTLFLDEIGNLPLEGQQKLLRVLQTGEFEPLGSNVTQKVSVRLISATNADLNQAVTQGVFREDLLYRLNVIELKIPPLAERKSDVLPLTRLFLSADKKISPAAERALMAYDWPGNVRELQNRIQRAELLSESATLEPVDLGFAEDEGEDNGSGAETLSAELIVETLRSHHGVIAKAARSLNLSRQALYRRMEKFGIDGSTFS